MDELGELLEKIGMNETELKVYETIVAFGFHTAGQITSKTNLPYDKVKTALSNLVEKEYLKKKVVSTEEGTIYFPLAPKIAISADLSENLSRKLQSLSTQISEIWKNAENTLDENTEKMISDVQTLLSNLQQQITKLSEDNKHSIEQWSDKAKQSVRESTNSHVDKFENVVTEPLSSYAVKLSDLSSKLETISKNTIKEINSKTDAHKESIEGAVQILKSELEEFADEVSFIFSGRVSGLNQKIEDITGNASENAEDLFSNFGKTKTHLFEKQTQTVNEINTSFVERAKNEYEHATLQLNEKNKSYKTSFEQYIDTSLNSYTEIKNKSVVNSKTVIDELSQSQKQHVISLKSELMETIDTVQENAVTQLSQILSSTSEKLESMEEQLGISLNNYQGQLSDNLNSLTNNVELSLEDRFGQIKESLDQFVINLKTSTQNTVSDANESIIKLKDFLQEFLTDVQTSLNLNLKELETNISEQLSSIVDKSNSSVNSTISSNASQLDKLNEKIEENLEEFQESVNSFLHTSKQDLQTRLVKAQNQFSDGVDQGVEAYKTESKKIRELQAGQLDAIKQEAENLSTEAEKARKSVQALSDKELEETKNIAIDEMKDRVGNDVDKLTSELKRFNEKLEREMRQFYNGFNDKTRGLRDQVPQNIENLFVDQVDRMENFRRKFESNKRFIEDFFEMIINDMEPGEKNWKRKEFQDQFYENAKRIKGDFERFDREITDHFEFSIEDTNDIKNEVLADFNKTIQDEINQLDELIESQGNKANSVTEDFIVSIEQSKDRLSSDVNNSITDTIEELSSSIKKELLTKFEQPLLSIIGKAQAVATGTEGVEEENRIIKAQNILIEKIDEAVNRLADSLQYSFEESIIDLDTKVQESIASSQKIVNSVQKGVNSVFEEQKSSMNEFGSKIKEQVSDVEKSVNTTLNKTIEDTKSSVRQTFEQNSEEVNDTVTNKTNDLNAETKTKLDEIDSSLVSFKQNMDNVMHDTSSSVQKTVESSINSQKQSLDQTLTSVNETTSGTLDTLSNTQSSLNENVGQVLANVGTEVEELVTGYQTEINKSKEEITSKVNEYFEMDTDLTKIKELKSKLGETVDQYLLSVNDIEETLISEIEDNLSDLSSKFENNMTEFDEELSKLLDKLSDNNSDLILDLFDQISTQLSSVQAEVLGAVDHAKQNIDNTVTNSVETVRTDILTPANEVVNVVEQSSSQFHTQINEISSKFSNMGEDGVNIIDIARTNLIENLESSIDEEQQLWQERGTNLYIDQSDEIGNMVSEFESKTRDATSQGKESVSKEIDKIPTVIDNTLDAAAKSMALLNEISKGAIELDPRTPDISYFDASSEAISANLNGLIERTKSSLTIVSPTISWINHDLIPKLARASVRIIIDPSKIQHSDQEILDKFEEAGVNTTLRRFDPQRYAHGQDLDMIFATRDKEEVMISKLLTSEEPYAFVSQDDFYIDKFSDIINPFQTMPKYNT